VHQRLEQVGIKERGKTVKRGAPIRGVPKSRIEGDLRNSPSRKKGTELSSQPKTVKSIHSDSPEEGRQEPGGQSGKPREAARRRSFRRHKIEHVGERKKPTGSVQPEKSTAKRVGGNDERKRRKKVVTKGKEYFFGSR